MPRLREACKWLRDNEAYIAYYDNMAIRVTPALGDCFQITLSDIDLHKHIKFVLLPKDVQFFAGIINNKLSELWHEL